MKKTNIHLAIEFINAIDEGKCGEELDQFYDTSVIQIEYPNLLSKKIVERTLDDIKKASISGKQVISKQKYEIIRSFACGESVIVEVIWTGTLSISLGKLNPGDEMKAYFAQVFDFKDGKIIGQRNYDCFENFL